MKENKVVSLVENLEVEKASNVNQCNEVLQRMIKHEFRSVCIVGLSGRDIISTYHMDDTSNVFEVVGALTMLQQRVMNECVERADAEE